ncbi:UMP-CMP kinase, partial [Coemansia sp. RSA 1752]
YAFVQYEDQRSTVLAVDNLNGARVLGRTLRVDHVKAYRQPKQGDDELPTERVMNAAPEVVEVRSERSDDEEVMREAGIDPDDPMAAYYLKKYKRRMKKERSDRRSKRRSPSKESQVSKEPKASRRRRSRSNPNSVLKDSGHPMFIGIGGGRGAGKEFTCRNIIDKVRERGYADLADRVVHLHLDDFHRELSAEDRAQIDNGTAEINFDHPESYDFALLADVMQKLRLGEPVTVPQWDHRQRQVQGGREIACCPRVVLVEGTLVLFVKEIRSLFDVQVFVDVDSDTRLGRQMRAELRDVEGPAMNDVLRRFLDYYLYMAKPSFEEFIFPTKRWADVIIPKGDRNQVAIELIAQRLIDLDRSA